MNKNFGSILIRLFDGLGSPIELEDESGVVEKKIQGPTKTEAPLCCKLRVELTSVELKVLWPGLGQRWKNKPLLSYKTLAKEEEDSVEVTVSIRKLDATKWPYPGLLQIQSTLNKLVEEARWEEWNDFLAEIKNAVSPKFIPTAAN